MKGDSGRWHQLLHLILAPGESSGLGWGQRVSASREGMQAGWYQGQDHGYSAMRAETEAHVPYV